MFVRMLIGYMHIFHFSFVQFMQYPVLDFGIDHDVSEPFKVRVLGTQRLYLAVDHIVCEVLY